MNAPAQVRAGRRRLLVDPGAAQEGGQRALRRFRRAPRHHTEQVLHATNDVAILLGLLTDDDAVDAGR